MIVAALRLTFMVPPDGGSTKSTAQKIKDRLQQKFKVAVAEVQHTQSGELLIGVAFVGNQKQAVDERVQDIIRHLHDWPAVELTYDETEIIHFDDLEIERDFVKYNPD